MSFTSINMIKYNSDRISKSYFYNNMNEKILKIIFFKVE